MTSEAMVNRIKENLQLKTEDHDLQIVDTVMLICDYCNIDPACIPDILEPIIRRKIKGILDYEAANGTGYQPEVASIKEGDGTITWAQTEGNTKATIYGLSDSDKAALRRHRRLRGYA